MCAEKMVIGYEDGTSTANVYIYSPTINKYAGSSGCTSPIGDFPYAEYYDINNGSWTSHYLKIDIWKMLSGFTWTSSIVIRVTPMISGSSRSSSGDIKVYPETASIPALASLARSFTDGSCFGATYSTLTVYDDGTYTLA
jgi:hypothetical protein